MRRLLLLCAALATVVSAAPAGAIVNGQVASEGAFSFTASLQTARGTSFCGGSVISSRWVLTAAHCVTGESPSSIFVVTGRTDLDRSDRGQRSRAASFVVHPRYNPQSAAYDVALIRLGEPTRTRPIALADSRHESLERAGTVVTVTGYGDQTPTLGVNSSRQLRSVDLSVVSDGECDRKNRFVLGDLDGPTAVCAGALLKDSCQGDSGGPLFGRIGGRPVQIGVVSYGFSCAFPESPGIYSEVNNALIRRWIKAVARV